MRDSPRYNVAPTHFLMRHLSSLGDRVLCGALIALSDADRRVGATRARAIFVGALLLLVLVLMPLVGKGVNGARAGSRWAC